MVGVTYANMRKSHDKIKIVLGSCSEKPTFKDIANAISGDASPGIDDEIWGIISDYVYYGIYTGRLSEVNKTFYDIFFDAFLSLDGGKPSERLVNLVIYLEGLFDVLAYTHISYGSKDQAPYVLKLKKVQESIVEHSSISTPMLVVGETGTGKGLVPRVIHKLSHRRNMSFIDINCAAIPETLIESELFGIKKGYTGLLNSKEGQIGKLEEADGGTVFLDELGKAPLNVQAKILKAIDEQKLARLGETKYSSVDIRYIAAVQQKELVDLLPDLKYRLGFPNCIEVPTLLERMSYIPDVAINSAIIHLRTKLDIHIDEQISCTEDAVELLQTFEYEGNYRELENILIPAVRSALKDGRVQVEIGDLEYLKNLSFFNVARDNSGSPESIGANDFKLGELFADADKEANRFISRMVNDFIKSGRGIKEVLVSEGYSANDYKNFLTKIKNRTGKGYREHKKGAK